MIKMRNWMLWRGRISNYSCSLFMKKNTKTSSFTLIIMSLLVANQKIPLMLKWHQLTLLGLAAKISRPTFASPMKIPHIFQPLWISNILQCYSTTNHCFFGDLKPEPWQPCLLLSNSVIWSCKQFLEPGLTGHTERSLFVAVAFPHLDIIYNHEEKKPRSERWSLFCT